MTRRLQTGVLLVQTTCVPGTDAEFNEWYDTVHVPEVVETPGFVSGTRYRAAGASSSNPPPSGWLTYLAVYELAAADVASVYDNVRARIGRGDLQNSSLMSTDPPPRVRVFRRLSSSRGERQGSGRGIVAVQMDCVVGADDAFNVWYDGEHIPDVLHRPEYRAADRFVSTGVPERPASARKATTNDWGGYLAIHDIECDDLSALDGDVRDRIPHTVAGLRSVISTERPPQVQVFERISGP